MSSIGFCVAERPMRTGGCRKRVQPLERQRQVRAALVAGDRVDLVDDHRAHASQHLAARFAGEQDVERLRRRHQDVRRRACASRALARRGVAGAHRGADRHADARSSSSVADAGERRLEVLLDVVRQRLERRDVDDLRLVGQAVRDASRTRSSIAARNAASVLPEPVGAAIRACCPERMASHALTCTLVGAGKALRNQPATAGWKMERGSGDIGPFWTGGWLRSRARGAAGVAPGVGFVAQALSP